MKHYLLLILLVAIGACTGKPPAGADNEPLQAQDETIRTEPENTDEDGPELTEEQDKSIGDALFDFSDLYDFGQLNTWEYKMTTGNQEIIQETQMDDTTYEGTPAWKMVTSMTMQGGTVTSTTYTDRVTHECLYSKTVMEFQGYANEQEGCPEGDPTSVKKGEQPVLERKGTESVTVGAGTFATTTYELKTDTYSALYYYASGVPLPVKIATTAKGVTTTMELESYS